MRVRAIGMLCERYHALKQWIPTRGTRASSGTRKLPKWHTQSHYIYIYINADSQEFTIFWKYRPPSLADIHNSFHHELCKK